jgi:hypothetical protein
MDKRNFNKAEVARLLRIFIESKTTGFKSNYDKEFIEIARENLPIQR